MVGRCEAAGGDSRERVERVLVAVRRAVVEDRCQSRAEAAASPCWGSEAWPLKATASFARQSRALVGASIVGDGGSLPTSIAHRVGIGNAGVVGRPEADLDRLRLGVRPRRGDRVRVVVVAVAVEVPGVVSVSRRDRVEAEPSNWTVERSAPRGRRGGERPRSAPGCRTSSGSYAPAAVEVGVVEGAVRPDLECRPGSRRRRRRSRRVAGSGRPSVRLASPRCSRASNRRRTARCPRRPGTGPPW